MNLYQAIIIDNVQIKYKEKFPKCQAVKMIFKKNNKTRIELFWHNLIPEIILLFSTSADPRAGYKDKIWHQKTLLPK
jgi:hypothetical protein